MKKCSATVIYKGNELYSVYVNRKGFITPLLRYDNNNTETIRKYENFQELYKSVILMLKANNLYCSYIDAFNAKWYDIQFINIENPTYIDNYGLKVVEK